MAESRDRIIVSPGPVHVRAGRWGGLEPLHHRSEKFRRVVIETEEMLRELLGARGPVYLISSSGSGAMEAAAANLSEPGEDVLVVSGGKFGDRWAEIFESYGCRVLVERFPPGVSVDIGRIAASVRSVSPALIALTHVESSTGLLLPLRELTARLSEPRPIVLVDAISSIGVEELAMDAWGLDAVVGACQKALAAPPGMSFVSLGGRALEKMKGCGRKLFYFSLKKYEEGREMGDAPFTPAVQIFQLVHRSLGRMRKLGWNDVRGRHVETARAFSAAAGRISLEQFPESPSSAVQAFNLPDGCRNKNIPARLASGAGIVAADGQGELRGRIIRTGFLGLYGGGTIRRIVTGLAALIEEEGCAVDLGKALEELEGILDMEDLLS